VHTAGEMGEQARTEKCILCYSGIYTFREDVKMRSSNYIVQEHLGRGVLPPVKNPEILTV
jgi:hypothetical protein